MNLIICTLRHVPKLVKLLNFFASPLWFALALLAIIEGIWLLATPLSLSDDSWHKLLLLFSIATAGIWGARYLTGFPRLKTLCESGAFLIAAWPVLRLYNHLTMTTAMPLADEWLAAADALLGFQWIAYARYLDQNPILLQLMDYSYTGLTFYSVVLFCALMVGRNFTRHGKELMTLFFISAVTCSTLGMIFPAMSASIYYAPSPDLFYNIDPQIGAYHLKHLIGLRSDPEHILSLGSLPGMVTFPSFHTAMGIIAIYCVRATIWLLLPSIIVNILMIASTPLLGSHYLIDLIAGALVALGAIMLLRRRDSVNCT